MNRISIKNLKLLLSTFTFLIVSAGVYAQPNWGIGFRLGDPSGVTLKKYFGTGNALELSVGRTHLWHRNERWYDDRFYDWYDKKHFGYKEFQYIGYRVSAPIGIQVHYLHHKGISDAEGLTWYYGLGGQLRLQKYLFDYRYKLEGNPDWYYRDGEAVTDLDLGADGVLGLEYTFKDAPLAIFVDLTLFMEVADNPFVFWFQGGAGLRFNF